MPVLAGRALGLGAIDWFGTADDGSFDESTENFTVTTVPLANGTRVIRIRPYNAVHTYSAGWTTITVHIDAKAPFGPSALLSTSHTAQTWSNDPTMDVSWQAAIDADYGTCGLAGSWDFDSSDGLQNDSGLSNPTHAYANFGDYTITLTVAASSAPRPCCAGSIPSAVWSCRAISSRSPRKPG